MKGLKWISGACFRSSLSRFKHPDDADVYPCKEPVSLVCITTIVTWRKYVWENYH